jgi:hypothetical protein
VRSETILQVRTDRRYKDDTSGNKQLEMHDVTMVFTIDFWPQWMVTCGLSVDSDERQSSICQKQPLTPSCPGDRDQPSGPVM